MRPLIVLLLSLFALQTSVAWAEDRYYRYELLIFENLNDEAIHSENWLAESQQRDDAESDSVDALQPGETPPASVNFRPASSKIIWPVGYSENTLKDLQTSLKLLENSPNYRVLYTHAWTQKGVPENSMIPLSIRAGSIPAPQAPTTMTATSLPGTTAVNRADLQAPVFAQPAATPLVELEGTLGIYLGRYLHVLTDLTFRKNVIVEYSDPAHDELVERQETLDIPVLSHRKMRSQELHYIDHPLVGILIQAMPVTP